jgi:hypothetical protein
MPLLHGYGVHHVRMRQWTAQGFPQIMLESCTSAVYVAWPETLAGPPARPSALPIVVSLIFAFLMPHRASESRGNGVYLEDIDKTNGCQLTEPLTSSLIAWV